MVFLLDQLLQMIQIDPGTQTLFGDLEMLIGALLVLLFDLQVIELLLPPTHPAGNCVLVAERDQFDYNVFENIVAATS